MVSKILLILPLCLMLAHEFRPKNNVSVTIILYNVNTNKKIWTYDLESKRISVKRHSDGDRTDIIMMDRGLTDSEKRKIDRFFSSFRLEEIRKEYISDRTAGESYSVYRIKINRNEKGAYVYYARPAELLELNRIINSLLPRRYHLWDEEDSG